MAKPTMEQRYEEMTAKRSEALSKAEAYAKLTLKYLLKGKGSASGKLTHGWTSLGAQAVNHMSNKVVMTMFPVGHEFFQPKPTLAEEKLLESNGIKPTDLAQHFAVLSAQGMKVLPELLDRQTMIEICKHLIVAGNVAKYYPKTGKCILIPLKDYVVDRDLQGSVTEFYWKQTKAYGKLSADVKSAIGRSELRKPQPKDDIDLFTGVKLQDDGKYLMSQEVNGITIVSKVIPSESLPFDVLRWNKVTGDPYGHGHVEDHAADVYCHAFLTEQMSKGIALMCDVKYLVKPGSRTNLNQLVKAPIGEFVSGDIEDVGVLQLAKYADFAPVQQVREEYNRRIGQAFMLNSAVRRDAERVTTYELRLDAAELESTLGGIYSLLAEEWQKPLAMRICSRINTKFNNKTLTFNIVTGLETLGKSTEMDKLMQYSQMMQIPNTWPQPMQARIKWGEFDKTAQAVIGLACPWMMDDKEWAQAQAEQQKAAQAQQMADGIAKAIPTVAQPYAQAAAESGQPPPQLGG